jgi:hypothetical protein
MTTMSAPSYPDTYPSSRTDGFARSTGGDLDRDGFRTGFDDTVRLRTADPIAVRRQDGLTVDATRLWTGGLASAAVAALVALVGTLVGRVLFQLAPVSVQAAHAFDLAGAGMLCLFAAIAALAATGLAHLLLVSTPQPLTYLGWIIGLATAAATVLPLLSGLPMVAAVAVAVINLVIGLAVGSLVVGAAGAALRAR